MFETRKRTAIEKLGDAIARVRHGPRYADRSWSLSDRRKARQRLRAAGNLGIVVLIFSLGVGTGAALQAWRGSQEESLVAAAPPPPEPVPPEPAPLVAALPYLTEARVAPPSAEISGAIALIPLSGANDETVRHSEAEDLAGAERPAPETFAEAQDAEPEVPVQRLAALEEGLVEAPELEAAAALPEAGPAREAPPEPEAARPPAWREFAVPVALAPGRPMIAIVIDDMGLNWPGSLRAMGLPSPITLSFLTYAEGLPRMTRAAREAGHELMLHVPMEPLDLRHNNPGPEALTMDLTPEEIGRRLDWGLGRFDGFVGINNHMGSRFTGSRAGMAIVLKALKERGLLFLDSVTSESSVGFEMARAMDVAAAERDVFLDHEQDGDFIWRQLRQVEEEALRKGYAIAIGHPHSVTLGALERWMPEAVAKGFQFVPVSAVVGQRSSGFAFNTQ